MLRLHGAEIVPVPMKSDGMDLDHLTALLARRRIDLVYTMPNFHNPTGITTGHRHRERLLALCTAQRVPILEDGFEEDLKYYGKVDLPIKSMDTHGVVIYTGTFSKALFPGLRLGWVAAERSCIEGLTAVKHYTDLGTGNLVQMVMHHFCRMGYYDRHLKRLARTFRRRMDAALTTMARCFPPSVLWVRPLGGYTIWVRLPRPVDEAALQAALSPHGLTVAPGGYFFPEAGASEYFRLSIASLNETEIVTSLERLGRALAAILPARRPRRSKEARP
jgi:DNA-binding transcriptional MocR family regulator